MIIIMMMINTEKLLLDYCKPIRTHGGFAGRRNNYIEYISKRERYENLSPKEYLNMIRPYLRALLNEHKPIDELNDESHDDDTDCAECKIQLTRQNHCISTKSVKEPHAIYRKSEASEIFMGSDTNYGIDKLFNRLSQRFQRAQETSNERETKFILDSVELLYYQFQRTDIRRGESYIMSPDWIVSKKATINPKN